VKAWALVALLLVGCAASAPKPEQPSRKAYVESAIARTVQVFSDCAEGGGSGSGVIMSTTIGGSFIATAEHVVDGNNCIYKIDNQLVEVVATDEEYDIAILFTPKHYQVSAQTQGEAWIGLPVMAVGFPFQPWDDKTGLQVTDGTLSAYVKGRFKFSAPIYFGNSGGPVFDPDGGLVGLVTNGNPNRDGEYFMTPASEVFRVYRDARKSW
jgi:S1-C subfamily serine protease